MRSENNVARVLMPVITVNQVEGLVLMKSNADALKKRLDMLKAEIANSEKSIIADLKVGATVESNRELVIKTTERRNVSWKSVFAEHNGADQVKQVIEATAPTHSESLQIR